MAQSKISSQDYGIIAICFIFCLLFMSAVSFAVVGLREQLPLFDSLLSVKFDQSCSPLGQVQFTPQLNCATYGDYRVWFTGAGQTLEIFFGTVNANGTAAVDGTLYGSSYTSRELALSALQVSEMFDQEKFMHAVAR
jgi:hypothetical protein